MISTTLRNHIAVLAVVTALSLPLSSALAEGGTAYGADNSGSESFVKDFGSPSLDRKRATKNGSNTGTASTRPAPQSAEQNRSNEKIEPGDGSATHSESAKPDVSTGIAGTSSNQPAGAKERGPAVGPSEAPDPGVSTGGSGASPHPSAGAKENGIRESIDASQAPKPHPDLKEHVEFGVETGSAGVSQTDPSTETKTTPANETAPPQNDDALAPQSNAQEPHWSKPLTTGNKTLLTLIESISGKPNNEESNGLLEGVVKITHENDIFTFHREDGEKISYGPGTAFGDKLRDELAQAKQDIERYGSTILSKTLSDFYGVQVNGNRVDVLRNGPEELKLRIPKKARKNLPVKVKEVRLNRMSLELDESKGYPSIRNISGVEVIVWLGLELHITPREFWRTQNERGDTTLTVGVLNPLPKAFRMALGLKQISYFSHTVRKKQERVSIKSPQEPR